ncbi:MAG TPA: TonB family protein [Caulobacterales bacterium]|nr:TonB family protein [Caulobacterales bacterium]
MADVLIVCVREDEPQAKSLADMFERAGFSVGGAPSNDGALRGSGAAVVVWSQASIRSRPFLDAAQRAVNAKKAIVACLIEPPPAASVNDSPSFDLRGWNGDPDDPMLDPLYFAVDRLVNAQRAAVGAPATQPAPEPFEPPPSLRPPPSTPPYARAARTAPPQTRQPPQAPLPPGFQMRTASQPAPAPMPPPAPMPRQAAFEQNDPLGSEAEHWRAIRHSNDPTDFLDYLAQYGPDGAFSELAEIRLKQLEPAPQPTLRDAARAAPAPAPAPRAYAPQPPPPPARRPEPAPQRRREPAFEAVRETPRYYDNTRPEKAPKSGGGVLRVLVLLLLLGGGALAAGYYFGFQPQEPASAQHDQATQSSTENAAAPADAPLTDSASSEPVPETAAPMTPAPSGAQYAANAPTRATPSRPEQASLRTTQDDDTPPPQTSWSGSGGYTGGPVSLVPSSPPAADASSATPQTTTVALQQPAAPTPTAAPAPPPGSVIWAVRPTGSRVAAVYPQRAMRQGVGGRVDLDCMVQSDLRVSCAIADETPPGEGFGTAALQLVSAFRAQSLLTNGVQAAGARVRVPIVFRPPQG